MSSFRSTSTCCHCTGNKCSSFDEINRKKKNAIRAGKLREQKKRRYAFMFLSLFSVMAKTASSSPDQIIHATIPREVMYDIVSSHNVNPVVFGNEMTRRKLDGDSIVNIFNTASVKYGSAHDDGEEHDSHDDKEHDSHDGEEHDSHDDESHEKSKPWVKVIVSCLIVNLVTFAGSVFFFPSLVSSKDCNLVKVFTKKNFKGDKHCKSKISTKADTDAPKSLFWNKKVLDISLLSFGIGALMATSVFLLIPETLHLIPSTKKIQQGGGHDHRFLSENPEEESHGDESVTAAKFGCAFLGGILLPHLVSILFPTHQHFDRGDTEDEECVCETETIEADVEIKEENTRVSDDNTSMSSNFLVQALPFFKTKETPPADENLEEASEADNQESISTTRDMKEEAVSNIAEVNVSKPINYQLVYSVIIGDFLHNISDGFFIGTAFLLCDSKLAWSIVASTVYHEIAQELADYILLTEHAGLRVFTALALNFLSGTSCILGGIIILSLNITSETVGILLALAAGIYIQIAAVQSYPRAEALVENKLDKFMFLIMAILGAIPIGLVLLDHEHCEA
eukprot:CAMPEP_0184860460 /NCGR_PEP_ID=MMETSP0580-20130426/5350_1 /TAXON_ID=1118495 /ORGANISM="Dactyliosolen fragilissimus" /LENGTH=566 /DNA_ID=CAMNT_0027357577 /DNA_START=77 /DNA_END=1777 /DNA_ORIENTATION=-